MKKISLFLLSMALGLAAIPCVAEPWLGIVTSKNGYLFRGHAEGASWSFDVPGHTIRTSDDHGRAFTLIDDIFIQVFTMRQSQFGGSDVLLEHRKYESKYLVDLVGATVAPSDACAQLAMPHQEWQATINKLSTVYVTIATGKEILVISVANNPHTNPQAGRKLKAICATLAVGA